jgi:hypothetical protein
VHALTLRDYSFATLLAAGGRSGHLDARANRWDADEYERLKEERERLKAEIDVSAANTVLLSCSALVKYMPACTDVCASTDWCD